MQLATIEQAASQQLAPLQERIDRFVTVSSNKAGTIDTTKFISKKAFKEATGKKGSDLERSFQAYLTEFRQLGQLRAIITACQKSVEKVADHENGKTVITFVAEAPTAVKRIEDMSVEEIQAELARRSGTESPALEVTTVAAE